MLPAERPQAVQPQEQSPKWMEQINAGHFDKLIDLFNGSKKQKAKAEMLNQILFYVFASLIIGVIAFCGYIKVTDSCTTGTIIAAVVGYVFGKKSD